MDETQLRSVEDEVMQNSSDADELGKGITNLRKSIQDFKKSSDNGFTFLKEQFAILLNPLSATTNSCEISASKRYETALNSPKVDFPSISGGNPYIWLQKCERYFQYHSIKYEEWVDLAELHLDDPAKIWYTSWKLDKRFITWTIFCNELCRWFDSQHYNDVVDEASKVEQPQESIGNLDSCKVFDNMPIRVLEGRTSSSDVLPAQIDLPKETHKLFDELTEPVLPSSGEVYNDNSTKEVFSNMVDTKAFNSVEVVIGLNDQENEAVHVLEDFIQPIRPGLESFHGKFNFICTVEMVEQSSLKTNEAMEYYFPAVPFQFYDQEDGIQSNGALNSLGIIIGKMLILTFDPGGNLSYHKGCSFFKPIQFNTFFKVPNQLSKNFQLEQEYCEHATMNIVELNEIQEVVFIFDTGIRSWILNGYAFNNSSKLPSHSNVKSWVGNVLFLFDPGGCVSKSSIRLSLTPIIARSFQLGNSTQAREPLQGQSVLLFTSFQALYPIEVSHEIQSEMEINCYTFIIVVEHFVWDPGTTVVVPITVHIIEDNDV